MGKVRNKVQKDKGSIAISAVVVLIIFVLFLVAAAKFGITFGVILHDAELFFQGS